LTQETSPYLLQHAGNPVDWYPWGGEALSRAKAEDKPILLSIGYSACHWCHVMAHESFENDEVASLMNENFINIKVDREERPDLDTVYMEAVQAITGRGGWPLTVFLTPEGEPFFGGTYFPPEDSRGLPGFSKVLRAVSSAYHNRREEVTGAVQQITNALTTRKNTRESEDDLKPGILNDAHATLVSSYDTTNGGFGQAPKFPQPMVLEFLLSYFLRTGNRTSLDMVVNTLEKMARGGVYDQIGGGFHRYSTDNHWLVPHFEKMLYDNALLARLYLRAYKITASPLFKRIVEETIDYVLREMTSSDGAFYSTQDADSEGEEGRYYTWTPEEIEKVVGKERGKILCDYYGVTPNGNFEGRNILHVIHESATGHSAVKQVQTMLLKEGEKRVKPGRDEKAITAWNGLMLAALSEAANMLDREDYLEAALTNGKFLLEKLSNDGKLMHTYKDGKSRIDAYLDDYALLIEGLLKLHEASLEGKWLQEATRLGSVMVRDFWDESAGKFYDTSGRHQSLFIRPGNSYDGALPSGASAATMALLKLSRLSDNRRFEHIASISLKSVSGSLADYPQGHGNWLSALDLLLNNRREIVVVGTRNSPQTKALLKIILNSRLPDQVFAAVDPDDPFPARDIALLKDREMKNGQPTVYVCENYSCHTPLTDPAELQDLLHQSGQEDPGLNP